MKEIGEKLKEAREGMGVSLEEAAEDLKLKPSQIEDIENGNIEAFKDIFYLKYFIRDYSKYLGLKYEDMVDEFNEFLFDYTSKISIKDIKEAQKKVSEVKEEPKIASPYTVSTSKSPVLVSSVIYIVLLIVIIVIGVSIFMFLKNNNQNDTIKHIEAAYIWRDYELTK